MVINTGVLTVILRTQRKTQRRINLWTIQVCAHKIQQILPIYFSYSEIKKRNKTYFVKAQLAFLKQVDLDQRGSGIPTLPN